jgi:hypothetical protein
MFPNRKCDSDLPGDAFAVETVLYIFTVPSLFIFLKGLVYLPMNK